MRLEAGLEEDELDAQRYLEEVMGVMEDRSASVCTFFPCTLTKSFSIRKIPKIKKQTNQFIFHVYYYTFSL